jgi:hypothetical protein
MMSKSERDSLKESSQRAAREERERGKRGVRAYDPCLVCPSCPMSPKKCRSPVGERLLQWCCSGVRVAAMKLDSNAYGVGGRCWRVTVVVWKGSA